LHADLLASPGGVQEQDENVDMIQDARSRVEVDANPYEPNNEPVQESRAVANFDDE